jgi:phage-related minor tail protein
MVMPSAWILAATVLPTVLVALFVRFLTSRFDGTLLILSGLASLVLAVFAAGAMQADSEGGTMVLEMSEKSFNAGVLSPVFVVATLTVMRGIFKFFGE